MGETAVDSYRSELLALTENSAVGSSIENEHWLARAKAVLDPNQTNIRRLAMISPSQEDIEAMVSKMGPTGMARRILLTPAAVKITRLRCSRPHSQRTLIPRVLSSARLATVVTLPAAVKRIPLR